MSQAIAAYLHYLSIFLLFALLTTEHVLFRLPPDADRARRLIRVDLAFDVAALAVLATGTARALWLAKGVPYYLHNAAFHAKVGLFLLVALLSILPTLTFLGWRRDLRANRTPALSPGRARRVIRTIRLELALLLVIPLLATLMTRGFGTF
jgi:putative membrane protein